MHILAASIFRARDVQEQYKVMYSLAVTYLKIDMTIVMRGYIKVSHLFYAPSA
jgi:hypothetical protein